MLIGIINRRIAERAPVQTDVKIKFINSNGAGIVSATATNISAGGMKFLLPAKTILLDIGDKISFIFQLPDFGEITVLSEVRHRQIHPADNTAEFTAHYGVKFLDFSLDNWNSICRYCEINKYPEKNSHPDSVDGKELTSQFLQTLIEFKGGTILNGIIEDLSFGGARINLKEHLPVNSCVKLTISHQTQVVKLKGCCIWCAPEKIIPQSFLAGIYFPELDQAEFDQLKQLINRPDNIG
jgi:hypothetical protein